MNSFLSRTAANQRKILLIGITVGALFLSGCGGGAAPQEENTDQSPEQTQQQTQQSTTFKSPSDGWTLHIAAKKLFPGNPDMTVNKYCKSVVGNMTQCMMYDGNEGDSRLVGVETIVGPEMYNTFKPEEKKLWMPTKDLLQSTMATMPDLDAEQFTNVAQSFANNYSKVYLLWDPGKINLPTGSPVVTVMNTTVATGTTNTPAAGAPQTTPGTTPGAATTPDTTASAPATNGGYSFGAFDLNKLVASGLDTKKGNFESSVLQRNNAASLELYKLKKYIGLHTYTNTTQLVYIVSGKGEFTVGDKKQQVSGGMMVIIPAGMAQDFKNLGDANSPLVFVTLKTPFDDTNVKWD